MEDQAAQLLTVELIQDACCGVIRLTGDLDIATVDQLRAAAAEATALESDHLIVDCRHLDFLDSSGLKALLDAHHAFGGRCALWGPKRPVTRVLEVTALDGVFNVSESLDEARQAIHRT